jgi:membrane protein
VQTNVTDGTAEQRTGPWYGVGWTVLRRSLRGAREDDISTIAQALAYSLFLAIPAILLVVLGVFSLLADESAVDSLVNRAGTVMPSQATTLLREALLRSISSNRSGVLMTVLGLALAVWTMSSAATALMKGVTLAFDRDDDRGFVRKRLVAFAIDGVLILGGALVLGLLILGPHIEHWTGDAVGAPGVTRWLWWTVQWPILLVGLLFAFVVVLYLAPDVSHPRWAAVLPGAAVAVVVWLAASGGFAVYTAHFSSYQKTWGTLAAVVITLVWLWLSSAALLFGAEVNSEVRKLRADR